MTETRMTPHVRERGDACISVLRLPEVIARTGLKRSTIYARMGNSTFPLAIKLGPRSVGWDSREIDGWIQHCIDASRPSDPE